MGESKSVTLALGAAYRGDRVEGVERKVFPYPG
ncbi:hypothetical protein HaLaN_21011 [Haematococcus lacustris]|uniref:Uncharacterized protein n=1 Tax=Haematococcus lacustris TaxID=44745 RepID=A0A699ZL59_HAELA|nr:hypothetical protein HaLaN_21011 [Haematococcus lacustris]